MLLGESRVSCDRQGLQAIGDLGASGGRSSADQGHKIPNGAGTLPGTPDDETQLTGAREKLEVRDDG